MYLDGSDYLMQAYLYEEPAPIGILTLAQEANYYYEPIRCSISAANTLQCSFASRVSSVLFTQFEFYSLSILLGSEEWLYIGLGAGLTTDLGFTNTVMSLVPPLLQIDA